MKPSLAGVFLSLLLPLTLHAQATVSLKAVAKNGNSIVPTSALTIYPGDAITVEIFLTGWGAPPFDSPVNSGLLREYGIMLDGFGSVRSGSSGYVLPRGWDAPIGRDECPCEDAKYPICDVNYGCVGPDHHPVEMAMIEDGPAARIDSVFHGFGSLCQVDTWSLNVVFRCGTYDQGGQESSKCRGGSKTGNACVTHFECPDGTCDALYPSYAGTLYLIAGDDIRGDFTFTFVQEGTRLRNPSSPPISNVPYIQPLILHGPTDFAGPCCNEGAYNCTKKSRIECDEQGGRFGGIGESCTTMKPPCSICNDLTFLTSPQNCIIDARIPSNPNNMNQRYGHDSITIDFGAICSDEDSPSDYQVTQISTYSTLRIPPAISTVDVSDGMATINFANPIQPNHWTCIRHIASNNRTCIGYLPGDVAGNRIAGPSDILHIIDNLNGMRNPPLQLHQCDIDRSGVCAPADILSEIDLLNGANEFPVQNGRTLPPCPSTTP